MERFLYAMKGLYSCLQSYSVFCGFGSISVKASALTAQSEDAQYPFF